MNRLNFVRVWPSRSNNSVVNTNKLTVDVVGIYFLRNAQLTNAQLIWQSIQGSVKQFKNTYQAWEYAQHKATELNCLCATELGLACPPIHDDLELRGQLTLREETKDETISNRRR